MGRINLYDEKTGEGWARVAGKWHYFQDGKVIDTGVKGAADRTKQWAVNKDAADREKIAQEKATIKKSKEDLEAFNAEKIKNVYKTHRSPITETLTKLFKDTKEASIYKDDHLTESKKQKEKYKNNSSDESLKDESVVIPEAKDMYSVGLMAMNNSDPNSDWAKIWNMDYSKFPLEQKVSFKAAMEESFWLGGNDTYTNDTLDRLSSSIGSAYTAAVSNPANSTTLGGMNTNDPTIRSETQTNVDNNIVSAVTGNTQTNTSLVQTPSSVDQQAEIRAAEVAKAEPKVTQWYDLEGEDGGEAAKQMARQKLADQKVEVKQEDIQTNQAVLPTGTLPESTFSSRFWDFLNNRGGGK